MITVPYWILNLVVCIYVIRLYNTGERSEPEKKDNNKLKTTFGPPLLHVLIKPLHKTPPLTNIRGGGSGPPSGSALEWPTKYPGACDVNSKFCKCTTTNVIINIHCIAAWMQDLRICIQPDIQMDGQTNDRITIPPDPTGRQHKNLVHVTHGDILTPCTLSQCKNRTSKLLY